MVELEKIKTEDQADKAAQRMGWADNFAFRLDVGDSLVGYWIDTDKGVDGPPTGARKGKVSPIAIIVHGRLFPETSYGYKKGNKAYLEEDDWERLF